VALEALIEQASKWLPSTDKAGHRATPSLPGLILFGQDVPSTFEAHLYEPVLCLILQGRKQVTLGQHTLSFGPGECLLVSHDVPVSSRITKAPYLAVIFEVEVSTIRKLYDEVVDLPLDGETTHAAETHRADPGLLDALRRYLALAASPMDATVLGPLIAKEIHYRLLTASFGGMLRSLIRHDSNASTIARAIGLIRREIRSPLSIPELARQVGMSTSSFHGHFKTITSTTPLQYQKELRLLEARRLLRGGASVTAAAYDVGYESPSQFSREYARRFGVPPSEDTALATGSVPATARTSRRPQGVEPTRMRRHATP
jgi:AraC-like DNA-binding protein